MNAEPQSYAQFGEDRILEEIFGDRAEGYCVEIGAHDGLTGSASYLFEKRGWQCLLVEPIPALVEEIRRHRACTVVNCAVSDREGAATLGVADGVEEMSTLDLTPDSSRVDQAKWWRGQTDNGPHGHAGQPTRGGSLSRDPVHHD